MCLSVKKVVSKNLVKCFKKLFKYNREFRTPFQWTKVPYNGWLLPEVRGNIIQYAGNSGNYESVHGGFIHAYAKTRDDTCYPAYAIRVVAYGKYDDLVCRALYVPMADKNTKRRAKIVEFLESKPTMKQIIEKFPFLEGVV